MFFLWMVWGDRKKRKLSLLATSAAGAGAGSWSKNRKQISDRKNSRERKGETAHST